MDDRLTFPINKEDKDLIKQMAKLNRLSMSSYCRLKLLAGRDQPSDRTPPAPQLNEDEKPK